MQSVRSPVTLEIVNGRKINIRSCKSHLSQNSTTASRFCSTKEKASNGVHLKCATLFSQKIHQARVLLDMLEGFNFHQVDCNIRL